MGHLGDRSDHLRAWKLDSRQVISALGLAGVGLVVAVLVAEAIVRAVARQPITVVSPGLFQPDPPRRFRLTPNYRGSIGNQADFSTDVVINSLGLRGPEIQAAAADGLRILVVGDSFVFGWGVEADEGLVPRLEARLQETIPELEVVNGGHPGFGLQDELDWLATYGLELQPDLIVLGIMMANDLLDATQKRGRQRFSETVPEAGPAGGLQVALYRYSHLFRLTKRLPGGLRSIFGLPESWATGYLRDLTSTMAVEPPELIHEGQRASRETLAGFDELARQREVPWLALLMPTEMEVDPRSLQALCSFVGLDPAVHDPDAPTRFFERALAEHAVASLDLTPGFRAAVRQGIRLFHRYDPHWTAAGHEIAAEELHELLTSRFLPALLADRTAESPHTGSAPRR